MNATMSAPTARSQQTKSDFARSVARLASKFKQTKVAESWDDELSDEFGEPKDSSQEAPNNFVGPLNRANKGERDAKAGKKETRTTPDQSSGRAREASRQLSSATENDEGRISLVLTAFKMLQEEFNAKFKAIWA